MDDINISSPDLFINRELSLLKFQWRVLEQAKDEGVPLLERVTRKSVARLGLEPGKKVYAQVKSIALLA